MSLKYNSSSYQPSFPSSTVAPFSDPRVECRGYTEPELTTFQQAAVIGSVALGTAIVQRPILKLDRFYFLSDVSGESNRIVASDKRAQFFRTLFGTRWHAGAPLLWCSVDHFSTLTLFLIARSAMPQDTSNTFRGFAAGALTGAAYTLARHPYDVLRTTAESPMGPKKFTGPMDVLLTALREKPSILLGIYKGLLPALSGRSLQMSVQFGVYNATRYDAAYRGNWMLLCYCQLGAFLGVFVQYPFLSLRQELRLINGQKRIKAVTYRSLIMEMRRKHGISKMYDGFFSSKPFLHAIPPAVAMAAYDFLSRSYTEYLYPEKRRVHASVDQPLMRMNVVQPSKEGYTYEFRRKLSVGRSNSVEENPSQNSV